VAGEERLTEVWTALMTLFVDRRDQMFRVLGDNGLTPPHGHALSMLLDEPQRMSDMAAYMNCDASYITALVDRLEEQGMVERTPNPTDRRVKLIALTDVGRKVAAEIRGVMTTPPAELRKLTKAERGALADLLAKVVPPGSAPDPFRKPATAPRR
jgi:DNA-binding MarR family transcriptional regulator